MTRSRLLEVALASLFIGIACTAPPPDRSDTILDLDCGTMKVRFQETTHVVDAFAGVRDYAETLLIDGGRGWMQVDEAARGGSSGHREGPEGFSRLLASDLAFRAFPLDEPTRANESGSPWGIFVDPKAATRAEYALLVSCLASNLPVIDSAFRAPRPSGETPRDPDQRRRLSSIVYAAYDFGLDECGERTIGERWECPGGGYLKTRLTRPNLILCPPAGDALPSGAFPVGMTVGALSADQKNIELWEPDAASPTYKTLLQGKEARGYYAACRDRAGRGLFETLSPRR